MKISSKFQKGFSLFEMLVVLSIVSFMAAAMFSSFPKMDSKLSLDILTQDIALTIRQAQVFGTTVFGSRGYSAGEFRAYGVSFPSPGNLINGEYTYVLFADVVPSNGFGKKIWDEGGKECIKNNYGDCLNEKVVCGNPSIAPIKNECFQKFVVSGKDQVDLICLNYINDDNKNKTKDQKIEECRARSSQECSRPNVLNRPDTNSGVDIVFERPKLQSKITTMCGGRDYFPSNVGIVLKSISDETRVVVVWQNGQIAVDR